MMHLCGFATVTMDPEHGSRLLPACTERATHRVTDTGDDWMQQYRCGRHVVPLLIAGAGRYRAEAIAPDAFDIATVNLPDRVCVTPDGELHGICYGCTAPTAAADEDYCPWCRLAGRDL